MKKQIVLIIFILIIVLSFKYYINLNQHSPKNLADKLDKYIINYSKSTDFKGSVLVAMNDSILLEKNYYDEEFNTISMSSITNYQMETLKSSDIKFRIYTLTREFTAMSILILEERSLLKLNDPIIKYIPDYPNGDKITIHHLLTNTSGITEYITPENINKLDHYFSPEDIIELFKNKPLVSKPGEKFNYCHSDYILLGYIIEKVTKMKYEDFIKENIFKPLSMNSSGYGNIISYDDEGVISKRFVPSIPVDKEFNIHISTLYSTGALYSTVNDLYKWINALQSETLVKKETLDKIFTPYINAPSININTDEKIKFGYGWFINSNNNTSSINSILDISNMPGFWASIVYYPKNKITIIILTNTDNNPYALNSTLSNILTSK